MSHDPYIEKMMYSSRPNTYKALQRLVMSAATANKKHGKKGFLGNDKFAPAFDLFKRRVFELCEALDRDGSMILVHMDNSWSRFREHRNYLVYIDAMMNHFKSMFPNWPDAYEFWDTYFKETQKHGIKRLESRNAQ
jgi:hypothetical protein